MKLLNTIRERYHPLWRLRQWAWYRSCQRRLDFPVRRTHRGIPFYAMLLRDFPAVAQPLKQDAVACSILDDLARSGHMTHFFDIGSNLGLFSWHVLGALPTAQVRLFEPDPSNVRLLRKTMRANRGLGIQLWEGVVAGAPGTREFLVDESSGATGSLADAALAGGALHCAYAVKQRLQLPATTLDAQIESLPGPHARVVVKIDVEGAEGEVIAGGKQFIEQFRPIILIECFHPEALATLASSGYAVHKLDGNGNYLLLPAELADEIHPLPAETAQLGT